VESFVPRGNRDVAGTERERAGEMDGVGSTKSVEHCEFSGRSLDFG